MLALITTVVMARAFAETPWLMLPLVSVWISLSTYVGVTRKLGVGVRVIQIVCLITFYGIVFSPDEIGWNAAAALDGCAIAFGVTVVFDNWSWPDPLRLRTFPSPAKVYLHRPSRHRLPTYPHIWRFLIKRWPTARPSIAARSWLLRLRARLASVLKSIASSPGGREPTP